MSAIVKGMKTKTAVDGLACLIGLFGAGYAIGTGGWWKLLLYLAVVVFFYNQLIGDIRRP